MQTLPPGFAAQFLGAQYATKRWAWATMDSSGTLEAFGGEWEHFGWDHPTVGDSAVDALPCLVGIIPLSGVQSLPAVLVRPGVSADVLLFPSGGGLGLMAHDVTDQVLMQGRLQQEGNQLSLVNARLTGQSLGSSIHSSDDLLSLLKMAVFECDEQGICRAMGALAPWADAFVEPEEAGGTQVGRILRSGDGLGFLDNFIEDAREFWDAANEGHFSSGVWCNGNEDGGGDCFEALAVLDELGHRSLVIERVDARFAERQRVMQRARQAHLDLENLEGEVQKKEVLLQCIVHDLRGPLSNMVGVLGLLRSRALEPSKITELLDLAQSQADRQDRMMRELLTIFAAEVADLQSFETDPERAPDLGQVVKERIFERTPAFEAQKVTLSYQLPVEPVILPVAADRNRLDRVLSNLLENTLQHVPAGTEVEVQVAMDWHTEPPQAEVRVLDRGPGVPKEMQSTIFDRFITGSGPGGSVGLGLYFCRNTVQTWGGTCGYRDRNGGGAEFWIRLQYLGSMRTASE